MMTKNERVALRQGWDICLTDLPGGAACGSWHMPEWNGQHGALCGFGAMIPDYEHDIAAAWPLWKHLPPNSWILSPGPGNEDVWEFGFWEEEDRYCATTASAVIVDAFLAEGK